MTISTGDRLEILELVARLDTAASDRDVAAYLALLTEDAVMDGEKGSFRGRDAIGRTVGAVWAAEGDETAHLTLNAIIDEDPQSSTEAIVRSTLLIVGQQRRSELISVSPITQRVVKTDGEWRVARRTIGRPISQ
jgi:ketosteroid isomerase-like protein